MVEFFDAGPEHSRELFHDANPGGSGTRRALIQGGMATIIVNTDEITSAISGVQVNVDDLEGLTQSGNDFLAAISGNTDSVESLLTAIELNTASIEIDASGIQLNTDDLEGLSQSGNDFLAAISGQTDNLETLATAGNASLSSIDGDTTAIAASVVAIDGNTDQIEPLLIAISGHVDEVEGKLDILDTSVNTIAAASSGSIITDPDGTTQANVQTVSGANALFVQVDAVLDSQGVLASGGIDAGVFSADVDISSQLGFYNNALFVFSSLADSIDIYANSDGGAFYAKVKTLTFDAVNTYLYYDLKGYESNIKILPTTSGVYSVALVRNR